MVALAALVARALLQVLLPYPISDELLFGTPDTREYRAVGEWVLGGGGSPYTEVRPYLYPALIGLAHRIGGAWGIWTMHALAWWTTVVLVFLATLRVSGRKWAAWTAAAIVVANFSFHAISHLALTETLTALLLAVLALIIVSWSTAWRTPAFLCATTFLLVLLGLLRPVFIPLLMLWVVAGLVIRLRQPRPSWHWGLLFLLALSPLLPQLWIMQRHHGHWGISNIGTLTFRNYFFARGHGELTGQDRDQALADVARMTSTQVRHEVLAHRGKFFALYYDLLEANTYYAGGTTLELDGGKAPVRAVRFMERTNKWYYVLHKWMLLPVLFIAFLRWRQQDYARLIIILALGGTTLLIVLASGISFWQGDRLILPTIALWPVLYLGLLPERAGA